MLDPKKTRNPMRWDEVLEQLDDDWSRDEEDEKSSAFKDKYRGWY